MVRSSADRAGASFRQILRQDSRLRIQKCLILMRIIALAAFRFRSGRHVFFLLLLQLVGNRPIIH